MGGGSSSAGYFLADHGRVTLVEAEEMLGFHPAGRSAALFSGHYGIPAVLGVNRRELVRHLVATISRRVPR